CAIPNGHAAIGSVLPRENRKVELVPCRGLAPRMPASPVIAAAASWVEVCGSLVSPKAAAPNADPTSATPEPLRKSRRPNDGPLSFLSLIMDPQSFFNLQFEFRIELHAVIADRA